MKDLLLGDNVVVKTLNLEISRCHSANYVKEFYISASRTSSTIIFPHSTNQIIVFWCCLCCCRQSTLKLPIISSKISPLVPVPKHISWSFLLVFHLAATLDHPCLCLGGQFDETRDFSAKLLPCGNAGRSPHVRDRPQATMNIEVRPCPRRLPQTCKRVTKARESCLLFLWKVNYFFL